MNCPRCGSINNSCAKHCYCGYDFTTQQSRVCTLDPRIHQLHQRINQIDNELRKVERTQSQSDVYMLLVYGLILLTTFPILLYTHPQYLIQSSNHIVGNLGFYVGYLVVTYVLCKGIISFISAKKQGLEFK